MGGNPRRCLRFRGIVKSSGGVDVWSTVVVVMKGGL